jgi:Flp pilus assembly protein TadG
MTPGKGWLDWLLSEERRQARRRKSLPLVAYYWDGANPVAHQVRDASAAGLYLVTQHRWYPGTVLAMTLQHTGMEAEDPERAIAVNAKVVRTGDDGVGFEFILPEKGANPRNFPGMPAPLIDKKRLKSFLNRATETKGQALIEFALSLPLLFLLILNVVNFGGFFYAWITVADAARAGANYSVLGGAAAGHQTQPSLTLMTSVITADVASLPNKSSTVVTACEYAGGAVKALTYGGVTNCSFTMSADPESVYSIVEVQVQYTYHPFFSAFSFPNLGVHLTIPPTTITQVAEMRVIQ